MIQSDPWYGTSVGSESFSDLDFADDVALLAESLLVLALEIVDKEARPLGLTINWSQTKSQTMLDPAPAGNQVTINGHSVEVVESFPCLGSLIHCTGDSAPGIKHSITRDCMMALSCNIWRSRISVITK